MLVPSQGMVSSSVFGHESMTLTHRYLVQLCNVPQPQVCNCRLPFRIVQITLRASACFVRWQSLIKVGVSLGRPQLKNLEFVPLIPSCKVKTNALAPLFFVETNAIPWFPTIAYFLLSRDLPLLLPRPPRLLRGPSENLGNNKDKRHVLVRLLPFLPASGSSSCFASHPFPASSSPDLRSP